MDGWMDSQNHSSGEQLTIHLSRFIEEFPFTVTLFIFPFAFIDVS
jgi:hypothetical protein